MKMRYSCAKRPSSRSRSPRARRIRAEVWFLAIGLIAAWPSNAPAVLLHFVADPINSANECPACTSANGTGCGAFTLDTATGDVRFYIVHNQAGETAAHVHGPAGLCPATAGILKPLPVGLIKIGTYNLTAVQQVDMQNSLHYTNIHIPPPCASGAIRGQIVPAGPTEACCLPNNMCMDTPADTCVCLGGFSRGPGSACQGDANGNQIDDACEYKNWVIADDFCFTPECPECQCDFDGDGVCTTFGDFQMMQNCFGPVVPGCEFADLNCDGQVDAVDQNIWVCLANNNPPNVCCPTVTPPPPPPITDLQWYGSWLDPNFDPKITVPPRMVDGWLVALHRDIPPQPCPTGADYDACGIVDPTAPCPTFTPDGSATPIPLATPACGVAGCVIPPAGYWRICARYLPNCTSGCSPAPGALCVLQFLPCDSGISRPRELIAQWAFDEPVVPWVNAGKVGCDQHNIFCWGPVPLYRGCLLHNCAGADEINPLNPGVFNPRPGEVYWLSIQAEVGHKIVQSPQPCCVPGGGCQMLTHADCLANNGIPQAGASCNVATCSPPGPAAPPEPCTEVPTGQTVDRDFWGWHTTPPGYHNKDDAFMGMLSMGCRMEWLYNWMNHLHWSQPPYFPCADDPTKSIDMAYYLLSNGAVVWCQPVNPGPPPPGPPPPTRKFPPIGGVDELVNTTAIAQIEIFGFGTGNVNAQGPTRIQRSNPLPGIPNTVPIEIISMSLTGNSPFGPATVIERPDAHSPGQAIGQAVPGVDFPAQSFFDVFVEVQLPGAPPGLQNLITQNPVRVNALGGIHEVPPSMADYQGPQFGPELLYDRSNPGQPVGRLHFVSHRVNYRGGIDIHSDVDWRNSPMECTCLGDMNADSLLNGGDIQLFVNCMLLQLPPPLGCPCDCADMDDDEDIDFTDLGLFVNQMLQNPKATCPPILCP
ncbi:MAG TPA: CHRD domain-containing protein [Phycisphaerae bacterium]|nr:CHRD domain-containing protein [Phycisphaerae bacterium]